MFWREFFTDEASEEADEVVAAGVTVTFDFTDADYQRAKEVATLYSFGLADIEPAVYDRVQSYIHNYQARYNAV